MNYPLIDNTWNENNLTTEGINKIPAATFVSCFIKGDVVKKVGLPIKEYFILGDDTEYTQRMSKHFPSFFVRRSVVTHKMKENKGTENVYEITDKARVERLFYSFRNDCCTYKRTSFKKSVLIRYVIFVLN